MDDNFVDILLDMLAYLEVGHPINPTSVIHDEFKTHLMHYGFITEEALKRRIAEFVDDGLKPANK